MISINRSVFWTGFLTATFLSTSVMAQVYVAPGSGAVAGDLVHIDVSTCDMTTVGTIGFSLTGMAVDSEGNLYGSESTSFGATNGRLIRINKSNGAGLAVGEMTDGIDTNPSVPDITFDGQTLYGWTESGDDLVTLDQFTGAQLSKVVSTQSSAGTGLAAAADGTLYGTLNGENLYTVDPVTGDTVVAVVMTGLSGIGVANAIDFDGQDRLWANVKPQGPSNEGTLVLINKDDGTFVTVCTGLPFESDSLVYYATADDLIFKDGFGLLPFPVVR